MKRTSAGNDVPCVLLTVSSGGGRDEGVTDAGGEEERKGEEEGRLDVLVLFEVSATDASAPVVAKGGSKGTHLGRVPGDGEDRDEGSDSVRQLSHSDIPRVVLEAEVEDDQRSVVCEGSH
jgi:hypothetical protein